MAIDYSNMDIEMAQNKILTPCQLLLSLNH